MKNDDKKLTTTEQVATANKEKGKRVRSGIKAGPGSGPAGGVWLNHNQAKGVPVRIRSGVKAGGMRMNHNQSIARG